MFGNRKRNILDSKGKDEKVYLKHVEDIIKNKTNRAQLLIKEFEQTGKLDFLENGEPRPNEPFAWGVFGGTFSWHFVVVWACFVAQMACLVAVWGCFVAPSWQYFRFVAPSW